MGSMASNTPRIQSTSPLGEDGVVRCQHGEQAVKFTSRTPRNPDRDFYKCSRIRDSNLGECCSFFYWDDMIPRPSQRENKPAGTATSPVTRSDSISTTMGTSQSSSTISYTPGPSGGPGPCTPLTPQTYGLPSAPHPVTPVKRKSDVDAGTGFTLASASKKARLAAIEAGLKVRQEERTQQSQQPQQHQPQEEETQSEASQHPPQPRFSFLGLPPTQESMTSVSQPSTPKRTSSASNVNQQQPTPPQTSQCRLGRTFNVNSQRPEPTTPTRHKGKERAYPLYDRYLQEENENPFLEGSSSEGITDADALPVFSSTQESSLEPLTTAEQINASVTGMNECIQLLNEHFEKFVGMDSVKHIELLERQKNALEVGDSAKKRLIVRLLAEKEASEQKLREAEEQCRLKDETIASLKDKIIELVSQR